MAAEQPTVSYRDVPGHPAYRVGDDGTIWSNWHRSGPGGGRRGSRVLPGGPWKLLKAMTDGYGRKSVMLRPGNRQAFVHQLILEAFVGPCPEGMECCHNDGNPANNRLTNLRWDTHKANAADQVLHGTHHRGERHGLAKLTDHQVRSIRAEYARGGISQGQLAAKYGTTQSNVWRVIHRTRWAHVV